MIKKKERNSLLKRVPMFADLLLGEIIYFVLGEIIILLAVPDKWKFSLGFIIGVFLAIGILIHMTLSVEDSVSMYEDEALKHNSKKYIIRILIVFVVFLLVIFIDIANVLAVLIGVMALKVAAYIQPITHKLIIKFKK